MVVFSTSTSGMSDWWYLIIFIIIVAIIGIVIFAIKAYIGSRIAVSVVSKHGRNAQLLNNSTTAFY